MLKQSAVLVFASLLVAGGCRAQDSEKDEPAQAPKTAEPEMTGETPPMDEPAEADGLALTVIAVEVESELASLCKIETNKAFFSLDSAKLDAEARDKLRQIAECVQSETVGDRKLRLVGHTDPRGTDEYNKQLGKSRAETVADFLTEEGLAKDRVEVESKGEQAATPLDDRGMQYDRRVDIRLAE